MSSTKTDISRLLPEEISQVLKPLGEPSYRGNQIFSWIWCHDARNFVEMTNLPMKLRDMLEEKLCFHRLFPQSVSQSADGTKKIVFRLEDKEVIYSVLMPMEGYATVCVSSQVGCRMGCRFCLTGNRGFTRNLTAGEIAGQVWAAKRLTNGLSVRNVVLMGMGEPLDNLDEVIRAVRIITHIDGLAIARRRVTVSTVGLADRIARFIEAGTGASLAISICSMFEEVRRKLVPTARHNPLEKIVQVLREHQMPLGHRFTIEYLMIENNGDSPEDAKRLSRLLAIIPAKVNLIPFNPWDGCPFTRPSPEVINRFRDILVEKNHIVTIRHSRGQDIGAACGQLA